MSHDLRVSSLARFSLYNAKFAIITFLGVGVGTYMPSFNIVAFLYSNYINLISDDNECLSPTPPPMSPLTQSDELLVVTECIEY